MGWEWLESSTNGIIIVMEIGKIDNETLERLVLGRTGASRDEVIVGPGIGEDCAVLDFGEYECVLSTDPITAGASRVGTLAVHISCNDVAANGVEPLAIMLTVLLPPSVTEEEVEEIARQADEAAKEIGVQIIGGHTEVTDAVTQPVISAVAIGKAPRSGQRGSEATKLRIQSDGFGALDFDSVRDENSPRFVGREKDNSGEIRRSLTESSGPPKSSQRLLAAQDGSTPSSALESARLGSMLPVSGDLIIVTKKLALEGTALAAEQCGKELKPFLTDDEIARARAMIDRISVVKEGVIAGRAGVKAMHDVTEGGVLGAVWEVCTRAGAGAEIEAGALPFDEVTMTICIVLGLDPMRLISSGSMLMCASTKQWETLNKKLSEAGIEASVIGRVTEKSGGITLIMKNGEREAVGPPGPDEIYKIPGPDGIYKI